MITIDNYFNKEKELDFLSFPEALRKGHGFVSKATAHGSSWVSYHTSDAIKKTIDIYLSKLNEYLSSNAKAEKKQTKKERQRQEQRRKLFKKILKLFW